MVTAMLPPPAYRLLARRAADRGMSVDDLVAEALADAARASEADLRWAEPMGSRRPPSGSAGTWPPTGKVRAPG